MSESSQLPRVVHIGKYYPPHVGGIESHLHTLCGGLRESMDVRVLVASDEQHDEDSVVDGVAVSRHRSRFRIAGAPVCPTMVRNLRRIDADLVHVHLPNPTGVLSLMIAGYRGRIIATWHSDVVRQRRLARLFAPIQRSFLSRCSAIITTSASYAESSPDLAAFRDRTSVVPYGIDVSLFRHPQRELVAAIRHRYRSPLLLAVGRLVYYKGFEYLVRAMKQVDGTLLIIGDGPQREALMREVKLNRVGDRVTFLGEMQPCEIAPYYHASDLFVLPSIVRSEAFGIVQLEAMAAGKPVINTRISSGVPFVSLDGVTGVTVAPRDVDALQQAINRLLHDEALRLRYGQAASHRVDAEFSVGKMVNRIRDLYASVMSEHAVAAPARRPAIRAAL
ncbi:MAG TPA: glycosyltransferase [Candidatus Binataceae bacterium]|nr:glycosyltransferase [Candidatus Binataceae bacterium]